MSSMNCLIFFFFLKAQIHPPYSRREIYEINQALHLYWLRQRSPTVRE